MKHGEFVALDVNHSIVKQMQSDMIPLRDLRYYILHSEIEAIDEANGIFDGKGQDNFRIIDYDIMGWALTVDSKLTKSPNETEARHSQSKALLWVPMARMGSGDIGRISRTFLELAMIVRSYKGPWKRKTRYTKSVRGAEPFTTMKISDNLQQVALRQLKKDTLVTDFLIPYGLLDDVIGKKADTAEHMDKDSLVQLHLLTTTGEPTNFAKALVNVVERWWLTETLISYPANLNHVAPRIPLETLLYAIGESNQELTLDMVSQHVGLDTEALKAETMRTLAHFREISIRLSDDEERIEAIDSSAGIEWCDLKTMVSRLASGPLWVWLVPVDSQRTIVRREVSLLPLRSVLLEEFTSKLVSKEVQTLLILAPAGWGKTGALLWIAQSLEKKGIPIALYRGGTPTTRVPKDTVLFVDDVHILSQSSLNHLAKMQEEGFQIIMTLSQEFEFPFSEKASKLKKKGVELGYVPLRLPRLSSQDAVRLIRDNFPNLQPADYERLLKMVEPLNYSPEAIAFLSMQWEFINRDRISLLNPFIYSIFKTPPILFDILRSSTSPYIEIETELAALVILSELGGEIHSTHEKFISRIAQEITKSKRPPRYYKSFIEPINLPDYSWVILNSGIRSFLHLSQNPELSHRLTIDLYGNNTISKFDLEWTTEILDTISRIRASCEEITKRFLECVLSKQTKTKQLELIPYVAYIGSPRLKSKSFIETHYGWLGNAKRNGLLNSLISPLFLSSVLGNLAKVVDHSGISNIDVVALPIFLMFRELWKRRVVMPQDEFNASYLELLATIARRRMQRGELEKALHLFNEGIELAAKVHHKTSHVRLLCDKIQLLRFLSPAFCAMIKQTVSSALKEVRSIETLDTRPFEVIVRNQESMALLWCGAVDSAETAAKQAEDLLLDYEVNPPELRHTSALELIKSKAWALIERGLCEYEKENYVKARELFRIAKEDLHGTRHEREIAQILGYEPGIYLREGKIHHADRLVAQISIMRLPLWAWSLSGSSVAYYYWLFENSGLERSEESEKLRQTSREFYPLDDSPSYLQWFDSLRRIIYHRKKQEYAVVEELAAAFLDWLINNSESNRSELIDYLRTLLSFVLREVGICYAQRGEYEAAAKVLMGSQIFWTPICGSRKYHAINLLKECITNLGTNRVELSGWQIKLEKGTDELVVELFDEESALSDYGKHFWVGISEILKVVEHLEPEPEGSSG